MPMTVNGSGGHKAIKETTAEDLTRVSVKGLLQMAVDSGYQCALTGIDLTPSTAQVDHIHAAMDGGKNVMENLQLLHEVVNRMKGTMSQDEFVMWCCRVANHARDE